MNYFIDVVNSPIGPLLIKASNSSLTSIVLVNEAPESVRTNNVTDYAKEELNQYFSGALHKFTVPLSPIGTRFQRLVWDSLLTIPYGKSVSYQYIATQINNPKAVRAVGNANGKNPIAIIIPCHRVIGKNGSLTGYTWGEEAKSWLLQHERSMSEGLLV
ncbi:MAG: methylated-DNA-[protein]-cysteine S-methyltransferase [Candidatus Endobugula sp.]